MLKKYEQFLEKILKLFHKYIIACNNFLILVFNKKHEFYHGTTRIPTKQGNNMVNVEVGPLVSVTKPEEKRKIIGDMFMKVSNVILYLTMS